MGIALVCVCVFSSHPFWTSSSLDVPAGVTQEEGHTGFLIHLPSAVRALIATEETAVTQQVSHRHIKCQSRSWSQRGTKVNGSHRGENPLLRPTAIQIAKKSLLGLTNREHRKLIGVKTMSLGMKYSFYCLLIECCQYFMIERI